MVLSSGAGCAQHTPCGRCVRAKTRAASSPPAARRALRSSNGSAERAGNANVWAGIAWDPELDYLYMASSTGTNNFYGGDRPGDNRGRWNRHGTIDYAFILVIGIWIS